MSEKRINKKANLFIITAGFILIIIVIIVNVICKKTDNELDKKTVSSENHSLVWEDGFKIDTGEYAVEEEKEVKVTKKTLDKNTDDSSYLQAYDISIDGITQLNDYIEIRIPYDDSNIDDNADEELCVCGLYLNEETKEWENVLYDVDTEKNEVIIYTDHLSTYCSYSVKNESKRNAKFTGHYYAIMNRIDVKESYSLASDAMQKYLDNGGTDRNVFSKFAGTLLDCSDNVSSFVSSKTGTFSNFVNMLKKGDVVFDSDIANVINEKVNKFGEYASYATIANLAIKSITDGNRNDILQLYKESINLLIGKGVESIGSASLALSMSSVWILDTVISSLFETAIQTKHDKVYEAYKYYYTHPKEIKQDYRNTCKWREILMNIAVNNRDSDENARKALDKELEDYCNLFWTIPEEERQYCGAMVEYDHFATVDETMRKQISEEYKNELYETLQPVVYNIKYKLLNDVSKECMKAIKEVEALYNQIYDVSIEEEILKGNESKYAGYKVRFNDLYETTPKNNWTGTLSSAGTLKTKFTLIGFITAGNITKLDLYKNENDLEKNIIEKSLSFKIINNTVKIVIPAEKERPDFAGTYTGSYTDTKGESVDFQVIVRISDNPIGASNAENYYIKMIDLTTGKTMNGLDGTFLTSINFKSGKANIADPCRLTFNIDGLSLKYEYYSVIKQRVIESGFAFKN